MRHTFEEQRDSTLELIKRVHGRQTRKGTDAPDWFHLVRVCRFLELALNESKEGTQEVREAIILAGLSHDALEDTDIHRADLEKYIGDRALSFVEKMTNTYGDNNPEPYVHQVVEAEEEVRLIKLADLYDNCTSVLYTLSYVGTEWTEIYFLPIVRPMIEALISTEFHIYPATAARLKNLVYLSSQLLIEELERYKNNSIKQ